MWAVAIFDLKVTEDAFWSFTPAQFFYLIDRKDGMERYNDSRFGVIVSTMINMFAGKKDSKPVTPLQVMGYEEDNNPDSSDPNRVPTQQERELAQKASALQFRLFSAAQKWGGGKK